jgi:hypothetical protein
VWGFPAFWKELTINAANNTTTIVKETTARMRTIFGRRCIYSPREAGTNPLRGERTDD